MRPGVATKVERSWKAKYDSLGGEPASAGTAAGTVHRAWTNIKSSITGMDENVLTECERGEDFAESTNAEALNESPPADIKASVQRQYDGLKQNHRRTRELQSEAAHL